MSAEDGDEMIRSEELQPGTRLQHPDGAVVTLDRRKTSEEAFVLPGWWLCEGGGLADVVIDSDVSDWTVLSDV